MAAPKTVYVCQNCGYKSSKWIGKCNSCGEWNTLIEELEISTPSKHKHSLLSQKSVRPTPISEIDRTASLRFTSGSDELNRVLGGGIVEGSVILLSGDPGIGKSTLVLQCALSVNKKVLYVSGEESLQQIAFRAERIGKANDNCKIFPETHLEQIIPTIEKEEPDLVIIDSIQTLYTDRSDSIPGSISQIRECTNTIISLAKKETIPFILIGHINKEGSIAGPKLLEHMVDVVLQFEGDVKFQYRIVRGIKNRFGSTAELGIYEMESSGLVEVKNPSELFISESKEEHSGIAIAVIIEGIRPLPVEVQALVTTAAYGTPQRSSNGFDTKRLNMLLAILEKRFGFKINAKDVFINITGGIKVIDPALDLAVIAAILSSGFDIPIKRTTCFAGEVSLTGELKHVSKLEQRMNEADKLGMSTLYCPSSKAGTPQKQKLQLIEKNNVREVFKDLFRK